MRELNVIHRFLTVQGVGISNTHVVQGSIVFVSKTEGEKKKKEGKGRLALMNVCYIEYKKVRKEGSPFKRFLGYKNGKVM